MDMKSATASLTTYSRAWLALGFAAVATAAVMAHARAFAGSASSASGFVIELPAQLAEPSDQVDWTRLPLSNITPAESVAAYDR